MIAVTSSLIFIVLVLSLTFFDCVLSLQYSIKPYSIKSKSLSLSSQFTLKSTAGGLPGLDDRTKEQIEKVINENKIVLFMKGNKLFPQCGFSNTGNVQNMLSSNCTINANIHLN